MSEAYSVYDLAHSKGTPSPVRDAMLLMEKRIAALEAENTALRKAAGAALDFLRSAPLESGVCCCGDPVVGHGFGSGHSPVDALAYYADAIATDLCAALAGTTGAGRDPA